jgi:hypothetical protein
MPLLPWGSSSKSNTSSDPQEHDLISQPKDQVAAISNKPALALSIFALGSASTIATTFMYRRFFRRLRTSDWITPDIFAKRRWIKGVVTT